MPLAEARERSTRRSRGGWRGGGAAWWVYWFGEVRRGLPWLEMRRGPQARSRAVCSGAAAAGRCHTELHTACAWPGAGRAQPAGGELASVLNLDVVGLSRGTFWVNGQNLGRYWSKSCGAACPHPPCPSGAAPVPCQRYYSIPFDYLKPTGNVLTVLDEMGATGLSKTGLAVSSIAPTTV